MALQDAPGLELLIPAVVRAWSSDRRFDRLKRSGVPMSQLNDRGDNVRDLTPEEVARGLAENRYLLVDVRELNEIEAEGYPDAVVVPLSVFDASQIRDPLGREVVFACRSGRRSVTASLAAQEQGYAYKAHLAGGILAWKASGLPTKT
jgi:rhodanese-related sulfurtransferase